MISGSSAGGNPSSTPPLPPLPSILTSVMEPMPPLTFFEAVSPVLDSVRDFVVRECDYRHREVSYVGDALGDGRPFFHIDFVYVYLDDKVLFQELHLLESETTTLLFFLIERFLFGPQSNVDPRYD
jgi:hypothetical protein